MKKTFPEKLRRKVKNLCKKYPGCRKLFLAYEAVVLFFYHFGMHFASNGKRYLSICVFLLFFLTNSSFAFYGSDTVKAETFEESDITLAGDEQLSPENVGILEDEDVLDEYANGDSHPSGTEEQYTLDDILKEHGKYLNTSEGTKEEQKEDILQNMPEFQADDWRLVLINKQHPIPAGYTFQLETIKDGMQCDERILEDLVRMLTEARKQGMNLVIRSPYRDMNRQEYLFNRKIDRYMGNGMSYMDAYKTASLSVTVPGASEHQIGLALDITSNTYVTLDENFENTEEGKWLAEHSCEYGFILRYPKGKEYVTSIQYEPWHFRYVGVEAATVIMKNELTLEEFWDEYVY